jgi:hypothetical protein
MFYTNTRSPVKEVAIPGQQRTTFYRLCLGEREKFSRLMRVVAMGAVVLILLALIWVFIEI